MWKRVTVVPVLPNIDESDGDITLFAVSLDGQRRRLANADGLKRVTQLRHRSHTIAIDRDDDVAERLSNAIHAYQASTISGAVRLDCDHYNAIDVKSGREFFRSGLDANAGARRTAIANYLRHDPIDGVDRHGKTDAAVTPCSRYDCCVHADETTCRIE